LGDQPDLVQDPTRLIQVIQTRSYLIGGFAVLLCSLYIAVMWMTAKPSTPVQEKAER